MICNNANAFLVLAKKALDQLSIDELSWFENLSTEAELTSENLAESLIALATVFADEECTNKPGDWQLSQMLYGLADYSNNIGAMIKVSSEAQDLKLKKRGIVIDLPDEYKVYLEAVAGAQGLTPEGMAADLIKSALDEIRLKSNSSSKSAHKN